MCHPVQILSHKNVLFRNYIPVKLMPINLKKEAENQQKSLRPFVMLTVHTHILSFLVKYLPCAAILRTNFIYYPINLGTLALRSNPQMSILLHNAQNHQIISYVLIERNNMIKHKAYRTNYTFLLFQQTYVVQP